MPLAANQVLALNESTSTPDNQAIRSLVMRSAARAVSKPSRPSATNPKPQAQGMSAVPCTPNSCGTANNSGQSKLVAPATGDAPGEYTNG